MARGKKTSSEDKAKVISKKIENPDLSTRDLERETGVEYTTASRIIKNDLQQVATQSETIAQMIDDNNKILSITWKLLLQKLEDWEKVRVDEVIKSRDLALKQNTLVWLQDTWDKEIKVTFEL